MCEGKGYAYHLFGVREAMNGQSRGHHHHHPHGSSEDRCTARGEHEWDRWDREGMGEERAGDGEEEDVSIPEYAHAVNTTCKVTAVLVATGTTVCNKTNLFRALALQGI